MGAMANSEDTDEMPHNWSTLFAKTKVMFREKTTISVFRERQNYNILESITCDPSIYTNDRSYFIVCSFMEEFISLKSVCLTS